jgi:dsRNA-specific ribonuclease
MISLQNKALIQSIEAELKYCFRDKNLLIQAFTRSSYHKQNPEAPHNEVLEFLGDSLLDYYVTDYFVTEYAVKKTSGYFSGQDEGALTKLRSHYTCNDYLHDRCRRWNISKHLRTVDKKELQNEALFYAPKSMKPHGCPFSKTTCKEKTKGASPRKLPLLIYRFRIF